MLGKFKYVLGIGACICAGILMIVMAITDPEFTIGSRIFSCVCGLILLLGGLAFGSVMAGDTAGSRKTDASGRTISGRTAKKLKWIMRKDVFGNAPKAESESDVESMLETFRESLRSFFSSNGIKENSEFQNKSTQLYWNVMALKKKRLDKKNIRMELLTERKEYEGIQPLRSKEYFDGKYEVSEYDETLAVKEAYYKGETALMTKLNRMLGHIVVTKAKYVDKKKVICPNCGAETTKENLVDGCDYCGTKFKIEDLGRKVSSFRVKDDYQLRYDEYKTARSHFTEKAFWYQFIAYFILWIIVALVDSKEIFNNGENPIVNITALPLTAAFASGIYAFLGTCFFWVAIFPLIQIKASASYYSKRKLNEMKRQSAKDRAAEAKVRNYDPMFSINAFYSNLQNKLAVIHFADTKGGVNAFFEKDKPEIEGKYSDVIDMDMIGAKVTEYEVEEGLQKVSVEAELSLSSEDGAKVRKHKELVRMMLVKSAECKTQEICGPAIFRCKGCGASLAIENGKTCEHCGRDMNLKEVDWVIRDYSTSLN